MSGHLGDRLDLRHFLTGGMLGSGICVVLFGMAYIWRIHTLPYFIAIQICGGEAPGGAGGAGGGCGAEEGCVYVCGLWSPPGAAACTGVDPDSGRRWRV